MEIQGVWPGKDRHMWSFCKYEWVLCGFTAWGQGGSGLRLCWPLTSLWLRQIGVCQPSSPVPNSSQTSISGSKGDSPGFCTQLIIWGNWTGLQVVGWCVPTQWGAETTTRRLLEWDASFKKESREITHVHQWQGLKKQSIKSLSLGGKVCPF